MIFAESEQILVCSGEGALDYFEKRHGKPKITMTLNSDDSIEEVEKKTKKAFLETKEQKL
jgi:hypothetical protein